jgi:hypothetical protein
MRTLHEELLYLKERGPRDRANGICANITKGYELQLMKLFKMWPKFSGSLLYPVPHSGIGASLAYNTIQDLWDKSTEYGRDRWEFLDFLIEVSK